MKPFKLERYFDRYELSIPHVMCASDCEPLHLDELLRLAADDMRARFSSLRLSYGATRGSPEFRKQVMNTHFMFVEPEDIIACVPEEGIYVAMRCLVQAGDHVVVTYPGYQSLYEVARSCGAEISQWQLKEREDNSVGFDLADLKAMLRPKTRLVVINFPHNPSGCLITRKELVEIIAICRERSAYLFSDEMYRFLELDRLNELPAIADVYEKGISLGGLSKSFGLPGLRVGWLASRDKELMEKIAIYKDYTTICPAETSELLGIIALKAKCTIVQQNRKIVCDNVALFTEFCTRHPNVFAWQPPQGGSIAFPKLLTGHDVDEFCNELATKHGILLLPASVYDVGMARVRLGLGRRDFGANLKKLEEALKEMKLLN